jgi:hypothetical protein
LIDKTSSIYLYVKLTRCVTHANIS